MLSKISNMQLSQKQLLKFGVFLATFFITGLAFAQAGGGGGAEGGVGSVAGKIVESFGPLAELMLAVAYIAGIGFSIAAIFKFKQHKDNPTQIPLGTPIALLSIGIALVFLGYLIEPLGKTLGAEKDATAGVKGAGTEWTKPK